MNAPANPAHDNDPVPPPAAAPRLLVTAGPTAEDIDAVRFLTNRSTGRMGLAMAAAGLAAGWPVTLILGPVPLAPPAGVRTVPARSAADMHRAVMDELPRHDALVMTAAVADYTPAAPFAGKIKKAEGDLVLRLRRTVDILAAVGSDPARPGKIVLGFSLDKDFDVDAGRRKLEAKNLDGIVVNTVGGFGSDRLSSAAILWRDGPAETLGDLDKTQMAERLLAGIKARWKGGRR